MTRRPPKDQSAVPKTGKSPSGSKKDRHQKDTRARKEERRAGDRAKPVQPSAPKQAVPDRPAIQKPSGITAPVPALPQPAPQDAPWMRSRLFARLVGAAMTGISLVPGTESLHPGLRCAAVVILVFDILCETIGRFLAVAKAFRKAVKVEPLMARADHNGDLALDARVVLRSMPSLPKLRITGRFLSGGLLAAQWLTDLQSLQTELLAVVLSVLLFDGITQIGSEIRSRWERWLNDIRSRTDTNDEV
ncbi:hypothetical protein [Streptomyces sp. NPDC001480]|uniref:hypothetical protein n=1 Tax=Streptomyces sp. NPDC001480 TaxID=3364577 RepID=UPI00368207BA